MPHLPSGKEYYLLSVALSTLDIHPEQAHYAAPMKLDYMTKRVFYWHRTCLRGDGYARLCVRGYSMHG